MKKYSAARLLGKKTAGIALAGAVALAFAPTIPAQAADGDYTYLYAALSYTDYYTAEGVLNGSSSASSNDPDYVGADRTEYDRGAFDAVSRATTNHGLHRGNYQADVTIYDTDGNTYRMDHWDGQTKIVLSDGTEIGFNKGTITKADGTEAKMDHYLVTGIKYVPVAVKTSQLADFQSKYRTVANGGTVNGGYGEGVLKEYSYTADVKADTNGLKTATENADGSFGFSERKTGTGSGIQGVAQKSIAAEATAAGQSVEDYLGLEVQKTSTYGDFLRVDFKKNYGDLGGAMQAVKWEYYGNGNKVLATYGTKFAADNWMHKSNGIQLGLTDSLRCELPKDTAGTGKWKVTVYALGYADTTVSFNVSADDLHGTPVPARRADLDEFAGVIAKAQDVKEGDVTAASWKTLQEELAEALENQQTFKTALGSPDGLANAYVYEARDDLQGAIDALSYVQKAQSLKVTSKTVTVKAKALKKKPKTVKAVTVLGAATKVSYQKTSGSAKISVNKGTGKVTVKKGTKKGTYRAKVRVSAAADKTHKAASKTVSIKVKVK